MSGIPCSTATVTESFSLFSGRLLLSCDNCFPGWISPAECQGVPLSAPVGSVSFALVLSRPPKPHFIRKASQESPLTTLSKSHDVLQTFLPLANSKDIPDFMKQNLFCKRNH